MGGSKAATSKTQKGPPAKRSTKGKAKSQGNAQASKSCSHKRQATDGTDDDESSSEDELQLTHRCKKEKRSITKTVEEVNEDEPEIEEVDEELDDPPTDGSDDENNDQVQSSNYLQQIMFSPHWQGGNGLEEQHEIKIGTLLAVKKETTKDLLTIFSDTVNVKFKKGDEHEKIKGGWCMPCK